MTSNKALLDPLGPLGVNAEQNRGDCGKYGLYLKLEIQIENILKKM